MTSKATPSRASTADIELVVTEHIGTHAKGAVITDPKEVAEMLKAHPNRVVRRSKLAE